VSLLSEKVYITYIKEGVQLVFSVGDRQAEGSGAIRYDAHHGD